MPLMYDSINVEAIPATATEILAYTDGLYANETAVRARFPNAVIHTISAVGQVVAEWIDVEPGCVWPVQAAADLYKVWRLQGCKGYYASLNTMQALKEAHQTANPGVTAEYFDANDTGIIHVDPGYVATQDESTGGYDITDTTPQFEGITPSTGTIQQPQESNMFSFCCQPGTPRLDAVWVNTDGTVSHGAAPTGDITQLSNTNMGGNATETSCAWLANGNFLITAISAGSNELAVREYNATTGWGPWTGIPAVVTHAPFVGSIPAGTPLHISGTITTG